MEFSENKKTEGYSNKIFECKDCRYLWGNCEQIQEECISCKSKNIVSYKDLEDYKEKERKEREERNEQRVDEIKRKMGEWEKKKRERINKIKRKYKKELGILKRDIKKINYKGLVLKENFYPDKLYFGFLKERDVHYLAYLWSDGKRSYFTFSKGIIGITHSLFNYFKNNRDYHKRLKEYKEELRKKQKRCAFCKKPFSENQIFHLHHKTDFRKKVLSKSKKIEKKIMEGKISVLEGYKEHEKLNKRIIENYSKFKDSVLACLGCHYSQHKELIEAIKSGECGLPLFSVFSKQKEKRKVKI